MRIALAAALLFLGPAVILPQQVSQRELSLEEAIEEALAGNSDLAIAEARREIAEKHRKAAASPLWPQVMVGAGYVRSVDPVFAFGAKLRQGTFGPEDLDIEALNNPAAVDDWSARIGVRWSLLDPTVWAGKSAAARGAEAAEWAAMRAREATVLMTRMLYFRALMAEAQLESAQATVGAAEATVASFRQRQERGLLTDADLLQAEAELAGARAAQAQAARSRVDALQELGRHLGWGPDTLPRLTGTLAPPDSIAEREFDPRQRADVKAREATADAAARAKSRADYAWFPALDAFAEYATHSADAFDFAADNWTVGLALRWTLFSGFARTSEIQRAGLERHVAEIEYDQALRDAQTELDQAQRAVAASREAVEATLAAAEAAAAAEDLMRRRFDQGLATAADLLQAEARATAMRERSIVGLAAYQIAIAQLEFVRSQANEES
ncbi:MAG TPA: TolC family protein [Gemmatimonadota bacterium]|nr:TolC family protein [Gemmatimonadota bacterium]